MRSFKSARLFLQNKFTGRLIHSKMSPPANPIPEALQETNSISNWKASLKEELRNCKLEGSKFLSIYRVPINMRNVEPKAYTPNIISIGPYHHGAKRLNEMERVKKKFFYRLFDPRRSAYDGRVELDSVVDVLEALQGDARRHYADEVKLSNDEFVQMMLIDGCFVVELLRELARNRFKHGFPLIERWMLPVLRRDLIMLENQLPLSVLHQLFDATNSSNSQGSGTSLEELALQFFAPMLRKDLSLKTVTKNSANSKERSCLICSSDSDLASFPHLKGKHFLDLFRVGILPKRAIDAEISTEKDCEHIRATEEAIEGQEIHKIRSVRELEKARVITEKGKKNSLPLDVHSEGRALIVPPIYIDDYRGTLFRNLVAFEQRHYACKPQVTAYLFFLDGLINSVEDVEILRRKEIIQHSLGSNKDVAELVNNICKEVARVAKDSYLKKVIWDVNLYMNTAFATVGAPVFNNYFGNWSLAIATLVPFLAWCLPLFLGSPGSTTDKPDFMEKDQYLDFLNEDSFSP